MSGVAWLRVSQDYWNILSLPNHTKPLPLFNKLLEAQNLLSWEGLIKLWSLQVSVRPAFEVTDEVGLSLFSLEKAQNTTWAKTCTLLFPVGYSLKLLNHIHQNLSCLIKVNDLTQAKVKDKEDVKSMPSAWVTIKAIRKQLSGTQLNILGKYMNSYSYLIFFPFFLPSSWFFFGNIISLKC